MIAVMMGIEDVLDRLRRNLLGVLHRQPRAAREIGIHDDEVVLHLDDDVVAVVLVHRSPSRNHTPGAICFTVFGCASPRVIANPSARRAANPAASQIRFIWRLLAQFVALLLGFRTPASHVADQAIELIGDFRQVLLGPTRSSSELQPKLLRLDSKLHKLA